MDIQNKRIPDAEFEVMQAVWELYKKNPFQIAADRLAMFNKVTGTDFISTTFGKTMKVADIFSYWTGDVSDFKALSKKYYIY